MSFSTEPTESLPDGPLTLLAKGSLIGVANLIPGVSGGTFALVLGIFDRLIAALHNIGSRTLAGLASPLFNRFSPRSRLRFEREWRRADLWFLLWLGGGAALAIGLLSPLLKWLLEAHPGLTLAFFVGLIVPSLAVPWSMLERRGWRELVWAGPGVAVTVGVALAFSSVQLGATEVNALTLVAAFAAGALAISAMVLPGVSGSFVLLVLGQYSVVLHHLVGARGLAIGPILWLAVFGAGCCLGLVFFARLLHWVMSRWRAATMAFLIGLVLGSFWILWPFKEFGAGERVAGRSGEVKQDIQVATAPQRLPRSAGELGAHALAFMAGLGGAVGVEALGKKGRVRVVVDIPMPRPEEADLRAD